MVYPMKTRAAVLREIGKPLELMELEVPELKKGQVLVEMHYTGLCQTQVNEMSGYKGEDKFLPHTLGHEGSGIVLAVGQEVDKVKVSDHVIVTWLKGEGLDIPSARYVSKIGLVNSGAVSTFLQKAVISENRLVKIPKTLNLKHAALFGCAIPTGAGIVFNECNINEHSTVAIFGLGGIGLSALLAASVRGAKTIVAIDTASDKQSLAHDFGAHYFINPMDRDPIKEIQSLTEGKGVDFAIEATGFTKVMETAFASVANKGGLCVIAGNAPHGEKMHLDPFDFIKGKRLIGTWGGSVKPDRDIPQFFKAFAQREMQLNKMISHETKLDGINYLLDLLKAGKVARAVVKLSGEKC